MPLWRLDVVRISILTALYFVAGKLGLMLAFVHASATAVWPPTGISLAALLVLGYRVWPALFLGAFLVNITTKGSAATSFGLALGNTLEGLAGAYLVNRFANGRQALARVQDLFKFVALAALVSTTVSASFGVTSLCLGGFANWCDWGAIWRTWWLGDVGGDLIVAPLLLLWWNDPLIHWSRRQRLEAGLLLLALVLVACGVFVGLLPVAGKNPPVAFFCIPPLVWAAFRFGRRETAAAIALLCAIATAGTLERRGPFGIEEPNEALLLLQAFMAVVGVTTLALAVVVRERKKGAEALQEAHDQLELRVQDRTSELTESNRELEAEIAERRKAEEKFGGLLESAPDAMVIVDTDGRIVLVNPQVERLFGYRRAELYGQQVEFLMPERYRARHAGRRTTFFGEPRARAMGAGLDLWGARKDGAEFPVEISLSPIRTHDEILVIAAIRDLSERKRLEKAILEATELERFRVGQDLHDGLCQQLTGIAMMSRALERRLTGQLRDEAADAAQIAAQVNRAMAQTRDLARGLSPAELETGDLGSALHGLAIATERVAGIPCLFTGTLPLEAQDRAVANHVYRIAQEAVGNAVRHARARHIKIGLTRSDRTITLTVEDDGVGLREPLESIAQGMGLRSIRYRADILGASLTVGGGADGGTVLACSVPAVPE